MRVTHNGHSLAVKSLDNYLRFLQVKECLTLPHTQLSNKNNVTGPDRVAKQLES